MSKANNNDKADDVNETVLNLDNFAKDGFRALTNGIRNSNALPTDSDWNFYKLNENFSKVVNNEGDRLLRLINSILRKYDIEDNINIRKSVEDKLELIVEANDTILENVGDNIDELNGIKKKNVEPVEFQTVTAELPISGSWNRINRATFSVSSSINSPRLNITSSQSIHLLTGKNVIRPQTYFKDKIDNSNNYPWQPRITEKPNSIRPLALFLEDAGQGETFCHPYETELDQFEPSPDQLRNCKPIHPRPISDTPLHLIQTPDKLDDLVVELRKHSIIGVDLEHHSYRTFMGITCLMQISTTEADYIIDTLELRSKLYVLNEIFTRPSIIKVFHGADSDILWLQRDLSLYVVNMFDTHQAAKQLGYSGLSLAYLLQRFCKFIPNKQFQLADWRIRPLPQELINYAREDTHYLIYIYGVLKNELLKQGNGDNILRSAIQRSTEICKKRYIKPILTDDSHLDFYRKCKRLFDNKQMYALKGLYQWRDKISREEDESTGYVLPNHMLLQIAEMLPREMQGILACCNPIPPLIRANLLELHQIILKAREQSAEKPIMKEDNRSVGSTQQFSKINIDSPIHCPHDFTKQSEFRDDLSVLLSKKMSISDWKVKITSTFNETLEKKAPKLSVFNTPENSDEDERNYPVSSLKFLGPYERYKLVKPYVQAEEEKAEKAKEKTESDDKSTDDRIASLHEHFLKVAKDCPHPKSHGDSQSQQNEQLTQRTVVLSNEYYHSLSQVEGPRKRKFEENCESLSYMHGAQKRKKKNVITASLDPSYETPNNPILTTVPAVPNLNNTANQKRKRRKKRGKNAQQQVQQQQQQQQQAQSEPRQEQSQSEHQSQEQIPHNLNNNRRRPQGKGRGGFKKKFGNKKRQNVNSNGADKSPATNQPNHLNTSNFAPFDYSSVDYGQFRGGASGSSGRSNGNNRGFQSKFRGKNKRKFSGNSNNKFSTFDNSKKKKS